MTAPEPYGDDRTQALEVVRSEGRLQVGSETVEAGRVRASREVDVEPVTQVVPRGVEHADLERVAPVEGDVRVTGDVASGAVPSGEGEVDPPR